MKLIRTKKNTFKVYVDRKIYNFDTNFRGAVKFLMEKGVHIDELSEGVESMEEQNHNFAIFGDVNRTFITSYYDKKYE